MNVTREDAEKLSRQLKDKSPHVLGVELFGSVLRNGTGHDVDLMVLVDERIAREWWADMHDIRVSWPPALLFVRRIIKRYFRALDELSIHKKKHRRQSRVSVLLGVDLAALGDAYRPGVNLDVWLMPPDWRIDGALNQELMFSIADVENDSQTRTFLESIARVAVRIA